MKKTATIDFNSVLMGANLLFAALLVFTFDHMGGNEYVDQETVVLGMLLGAAGGFIQIFATVARMGKRGDDQ